MAEGGVCGRGTCVAGGMHGGGHAWQGGMWQGACMAGGCVWQGACMADTTRYGDTVNERAVRILLECILFLKKFIQIGIDEKDSKNVSFVP